MSAAVKHAVIVLGGGVDQVPLVQALERRGRAAVVVDYTDRPPAAEFATRHVQESSLDHDVVLATAKEEHALYVTSIGNDRVLPLIAEVSSELGLPTPMAPAFAAASTNKERMREAFAAAGVRMPRAFRLNDAASHELDFPLVVKPVKGTSSEGVRRVDDPATLKTILREHGGGEGLVAQAYIAGGEISVDCFAVDGKAHVVLVNALHQVPGLGETFSILYTQYPAPLSKVAIEQVELQAQRMAEAFGLYNGPFFYQAKVRGDEVFVLEGSARIAGGLKCIAIEQLTGFDILDAQLDALEGVAVHPKPVARYAAASQVFVLARKGTLARVVIPLDDHIVHHRTFRALGDELGAGTAAKHRVLSLTLVADDAEDMDRVRSLTLRSLVLEDAAGNDLVRRELYP